jgi:hypothetical protein
VQKDERGFTIPTKFYFASLLIIGLPNPKMDTTFTNWPSNTKNKSNQVLIPQSALAADLCMLTVGPHIAGTPIASGVSANILA